MMLAYVSVILICIGTYHLISYYRKRLRFMQAANALPGPKAYPIIGNAYYFFQTSFDDLLPSLYKLVDIFPSPFRLWMGNKLIIIISEPDQAKTILQSRYCLNKSKFYDIFKPWMGTGLFTAPASKWVRHRRMLTTSFNTNILRVFCDTFVKQASIFMEKLEHMTNDEIDLDHHLATCTLDIVYDTLLGINLESQSNKNNQYAKAVSRLKNIVIHRLRNIFLHSDMIFNLTTLNREQQKHINYLNSVAEEVIQKEDAKNNLHSIKAEYAKPSKRIFLDILMEASDEGKKFNRKEILDEINTMMTAASDTTAITMYFTIFMLANFPEIQEKVYEELVEIYGTQDPKTVPVKFEDLQHMNYLERVIKETLRLFPIGPIIGRRLDENLQIGEYILPEGAEVGIGIIHMHRNEKYWLNALTFDPDRFLPENMKNIHPYCYIPFSNGPRNCIGSRYGMMSMKVLISTLLRTFILKVDKRMEINEIELKVEMMLASRKPLKVRIEKRN
ncbi:cytochrome P450 4C1 [Harpegnathos saltator]|uniref:cytochrome P450 4C1 n=1 Tax=Harpegnathos saltator TaxID=610380 RepID=UPI000DBECFA6|nr:cytochrome P450 4C1 [Harpegnathos saltator]